MRAVSLDLFVLAARKQRHHLAAGERTSVVYPVSTSCSIRFDFCLITCLYSRSIHFASSSNGNCLQESIVYLLDSQCYACPVAQWKRVIALHFQYSPIADYYTGCIDPDYYPRHIYSDPIRYYLVLCAYYLIHDIF